MKLNILVVGLTGSGKTSLIQSICGKSVVPDSAIGHSSPTTFGTIPYCLESENITFWDTCGFEIGKKEEDYISLISNFVKKRQSSDDIEEHIHLLWYVIAGDRARITDFDIRLINQLFPLTLLVITKSDLMKKEQFEGIEKALDSAGIDLKSTVQCSNEKLLGQDTLIKKSINILPIAYQTALKSLFRRKESEFKERANKEADELIWWGAGRAAAIAISPIPLADMPFLIANEIYMINRIGSAYGFTVTSSIITGIIGAAGAGIAGMTLASFLPGFKIVIAASITYGIGKAAKSYFESDMSLSPNELNKIYKENKKDAKSVDWKSKAK